MTYLTQMQDGVEFIECHLDQPIVVAEIAREAGMSRWHFQRIFRSMTGDTVKAYIRGRRMALAVERLVTTDMRIIDIALLAGYESQESFTRAFRSAIGTTPNRLRQAGPPPGLMAKVRFDEDYLRHLHGSVTMTPAIECWPDRTLVGMATEFFGADSDKNNIGSQLGPLWDTFVDRMGEVRDQVEGTAYGIVSQSGPRSERLSYLAGVAVERVDQLPPGMTSLVLPGATRARFTHRGPAHEVDHTVSYIYSTWLTRSGRRHSSQPDVEIYDRDYDAASPETRIGYAIPVTPSAEPDQLGSHHG